MLLSELFDVPKQPIMETAKIAWARVGGNVVKKYRCTAGRRKNRIVSSPADCNKPIDIKKRLKMKQTRMAKGTRMARKRKRTMKKNPASLRVQRMNKAMK